MTTSTPALQPPEVSDPRANATAAGPARRTLLLLSGAYSALFVVLFLVGGGDGPSANTPGESVISQYTQSQAGVAIGSYGLVVAGALLIFWGSGVRRMLSRNSRTWTADAAFAGAVVFALTLMGWAVSSLAMYDAVQTGTPAVAQAMNVIDHANFVPAMLGLACTMVGIGLATLKTAALPRWLAVASVVVGAMAPLGPGGFVPFSLFPIWLILVSALLRRTDA